MSAIAYSGVTTLVIGLVIRRAMGLRADADDEWEGLDVAIHGESAYDFEGAAVGGAGGLSHVFGSRATGGSAARNTTREEVTA